MPIANDLIAHTFYKMEHLATVHFENGKYHVHQELAKDANQKEDAKGTTPSSIYETLANHICIGLFEFKIYAFSSSSKIITSKTQQPVAVFLENTTPPPEV